VITDCNRGKKLRAIAVPPAHTIGIGRGKLGSFFDSAIALCNAFTAVSITSA